MARIVAVHGAFNELWGPHEIASRWVPAIRDGLWHHGVAVEPDDIAVCFYGDLFRRDPERDDPDAVAASRAGAEAIIRSVAGGDMLDQLNDQIASAMKQRTIDLLAVLSSQPEVAQEGHERLAALVTPETRVIVAHSLGTVLTYRALTRHPEWNVHTLVTLGSPLAGLAAMPGGFLTIGDDGIAAWPGSVQRWVNVAAVGDKVTEAGPLATVFGPKVEDRKVDNGARAHDPEPYLNSRVTGEAIAAALTA